ncbi:DUF2513 domain-containing protein [Cronobacter sakazakii]|uniref:DUF2513 domain-containing protein n=1 Tax=Cronobacter sakazakii TaxID=28141 RepID=UPI000B3DCA94|nr:DUF2513 domain-containing protein [Cronobacter sakazakii]EKK3995790.1 DUF2513 domain-containing protein [Cronobacter sakazakii]ELY2475620.1 DUF2513 domain-containing protein [Cronobacter sakazakii]ELY2668211.1 DUF2513 domain-containing protein [Cronobacter sakazakii]ELY2731098.1 DUF2513 domain-containing protein [Cronobacter sakazakii]ELY3812380.1 DUF2513 domain-containing protein [Cronobacter sakazakii]
MKINQEYLKDLLLAFEDTEGPDTWVYELVAKGYDQESPEFIFHMRLLDDNGLICRVDGEPGFGHQYQAYIGGYDYYWVDVPLRLTARGHDFIADLRQKEVWNSVKENFKDASMSTLVDVAKQLAQGYAKQKIKALTGFDPDS